MDKPRAPFGGEACKTFPRLVLESGGLYYFGLLELDVGGGRHVLRRRHDAELMTRACSRVPEDLRDTPVEYLFDDGAEATTCSRLVTPPAGTGD